MLAEQLKAIVGPNHWIDDPVDMQPFVTEWRDRLHGSPLLVVMPNSTDQVVDLVKACAAAGTAIVPQGGNTGLCGGAIPDESGEQVVLSLRKMNQIHTISNDDFSMTVDAGCTLQQVQDAARDNGMFFPLSLSAEGSCQIGGNLSTNAGGVNVLRYGTARQQVLGLEVVLADGRIIHGLRSLRKDTAGYDLKQLFIGAEGTLGIITQASLKLQPDPGPTCTVLAGLTAAHDATRFLASLRQDVGDQILAFELLSNRAMRYALSAQPQQRAPLDDAAWYVLLTATADEAELQASALAAMNEGMLSDVVFAKNEAEANAFWELRHGISAAQKEYGASLKHDVSVPVGRVGEFLQAAEAAVVDYLTDARVVAFGHVGDGNIHFNVTQPRTMDAAEFLEQREPIADLVFDLVHGMGGSFSAEHGVGLVRREYLSRYRPAAEIDTMRAIKRALDPQGILNPGKVL